MAVTLNPAISTGGAARDQEAQSPFLSPFLLRFSTLPKLRYPFFYNCTSGKFSDKMVRENFYQSIISTPGKSRDEEFTLHVLAREGVILFIQNTLVTRCPPPYTKQMSRIPIPKGKDKPGQTRPIVLVNDIYGFITATQAIRMSEGVEATKRLFPELKAYRKNMSTTDITVDERCMMEDSMESKTPMSKKNEDEEKFFDRVLLIIQTIVLSLFGFLPQGYMEMKFEDMLERLVEILTRYGKEIAEYIAGLPQGSPLSVILANLVMWIKHKIVRRKLDNIKEDRKDYYIFKNWDKLHELKELLIRITEGFSDDNESFHSVPTTELLCKSTLDNITLTGYFSLVTKLGRCGAKSLVEFWNIDPRDADYIKNYDFSSYAWSFDKDGLVKEKSPIVVHFRKRKEEWENLSVENKKSHQIFRLKAQVHQAPGDQDQNGSTRVSRVRDFYQMFSKFFSIAF